MLRFLFIYLFLSATLLLANGRCSRYTHSVKLYHYEVFGVDFPYWFGIGQLRQESGCRDVISRDGVGSQGLAQITYRIWRKFLASKSIDSISSISNQLRAQAYIMQNCKQQAYSSHLWVAYQVYNGGSLVNKEISKARHTYKIREVPHFLAKEFCKRKVVHFTNGQSINACNINYEYSEKVYKYGLKYRVIDSQRYKFW